MLDVAAVRRMRMMKKKLSTIFLVLLLSVLTALPAFAESDLSRFVDEAGLLTDSEGKELQDKLDEISERQQVDVAVVTVNSLDGATAMEYADDFYDRNGYGFGEEKDGILFLISMEERDWWMSTSGFGITAFTDAGLAYISDMIINDLSEGDYEWAFTVFADMCDDYITQAKTGEPYDADNLPKDPLELFVYFVFALLVGFVIALIVTGIMRCKLKSVYTQTEASGYVKKGSLNLTVKNDLFLYKTVDRRERPKEEPKTSSSSLSSSGSSRGSTTHKSSSGRQHGGAGGKF